MKMTRTRNTIKRHRFFKFFIIYKRNETLKICMHKINEALKFNLLKFMNQEMTKRIKKSE